MSLRAVVCRALLAMPVVALGAMTAPASAADLVLFSGGPMKTSVQPHLEAFTKQTGHRVTTAFEPMGELQSRLRAGVPVDVLIMTPEAIAPMVKEGRIVADGQAALARVGVGIAVGKDAPSPDITTPDALRRALLAAKSVVYIDPARGTSGKTVVEMFEKLGITEQMKAKTTLGSGGFIVAPVGRGEVELGIHQVSEILPVPGVKLVGELPRELQRYTTYVAALSSTTKAPEAARELVRFLRGKELQATFRANGLSIPD